MEAVNVVPVRTANHGKKWSKEEDAQMLELLRAGTLESTAEALGRSNEAVWMRLLGSVALFELPDLAQKYDITQENIADFHAAQASRKEAREAALAERKAKRQAEHEERQAAQRAATAERKSKRQAEQPRKSVRQKDNTEANRQSVAAQISAANDAIRDAARILLDASRTLIALQQSMN